MFIDGDSAGEEGQTKLGGEKKWTENASAAARVSTPIPSKKGNIVDCHCLLGLFLSHSGQLHDNYE